MIAPSPFRSRAGLIPGLCLFLLALALAPEARADALVPNGGFEDGLTGWTPFIAGDSQDKNCRAEAVGDAPHSGAACLRLQADDFARFCLGAKPVPVQAGDRYRVTAWVRADAKAQARSGAPGFAVRLGLYQGKAETPGGHLHVVFGDRVSRNAPADPAGPLPTEWTKIEAVFEVPAGTDTIIPGLFAWYEKGAVYVDDFSLEKADPATPVTAPWQKEGQTAAPAPAAAATAQADVPATGPVTSDAELLTALDLATPGLDKVKAAAEAAGGPDWEALQKAYLDYRRTHSPARWHIMPSDKPAAPQEKDDEWGDQVIAHHIRNGYHFQPSESDMGQDFDWTHNPVAKSDPAYTDEWTYCVISRTEFWQALAAAYWKTGNEKYAAEWVAQLQDFARKNPLRFDPVPGVPSLWRTLDAAERISISWPEAYFHFLQSPSLTPSANWLYLKLNLEHAKLLLHALDDQSRTGNWVTTECGALYTIGTLCPELRDAPAWRQTALDRLGKELERLVPPDGFEAELTPTYHFVALDGFRKPLEMAKLNGLEVPGNFRDRILEMYRAPVRVMDQSGHAVPTNDSLSVDIAAKAREGLQLGDDPLLAWAASHGAEGEAPPDSAALPYAGFYTMRGGWKRDDVFLFFRGGPTGINHEHEDMLEIVLRAWNKTLLFEPGTYNYDQSDWRRFTINTPSHSTIIVDGKWQHRGKSALPAAKLDNPWVTTPLFDYAAATYDGGYQENTYRARPTYPELWKGTPDKSVTHTRRVLFLRPFYALVLDTLDGTGTHTFDAHFQLDAPAARLDPDSHAAFSQNGSGAQLALYPLELDNLAADIVQGQEKPLLGWMPSEHRAIPTVRFRKQQEAPAAFATFLYPFQGSAPAFAATALPVDAAGVWARSLKTGRESADVAIAKGGAPVPFVAASPLAGEVHAEAAGLVIRQAAAAAGNGPLVVGGWGLRSYRDARMEWSADAPASLVVIAQEGGLLCFNGGDAPVTLAVAHPFARAAALPPHAWTLVSVSGAAPAATPAAALFGALEKLDGAVAYDDYAKAFPAAAAAPGAAIRLQAEKMTLPDKASLLAKTGAPDKVIARWEAPGTVAAAKADLPKAGWYRIKLRYASGAEPLRSLLVDGKAPFSEAEGFSLPSTIGNPPSDGWSNFADDWREAVLGASGTAKAAAASGWKFYLPAGPHELALRCDGGGLNLDWIELEPAS